MISEAIVCSLEAMIISSAEIIIEKLPGKDRSRKRVEGGGGGVHFSVAHTMMALEEK